MTRYKNVNSGAIVSVRDDKVLDSSWEQYDGSDVAASSGYDAMKAADLKAEIEKRNEGREADAKISTRGNKAELAAALTADDVEEADDDTDADPDADANDA